MIFNSVGSQQFRQYGRVITEYDLTDILERMEQTPLPEDVVYVRKDAYLEESPLYSEMKSRMYGESNIQFGYCNGHNDKLNALEYHRSSEVNIAVTDMILLLGRQQDITDEFTYDTSKVEAFLVPAGMAVEIYATTLHYAPCGVDGNGFKCLVVLPDGTNAELGDKHCSGDACTEGEDRLLAAANKWLIAHEDAGIDGAWNGLKGSNISTGGYQR